MLTFRLIKCRKFRAFYRVLPAESNIQECRNEARLHLICKIVRVLYLGPFFVAPMTVITQKSTNICCFPAIFLLKICCDTPLSAVCSFSNLKLWSCVLLMQCWMTIQSSKRIYGTQILEKSSTSMSITRWCFSCISIEIRIPIMSYL